MEESDADKGRTRSEYDYYCRLLDIWQHIDSQSWQGFNIFLAFEGATVAAFAAVIAASFDHSARIAVLEIISLLALMTTIMWMFAFNRRKEALRMIGHQARVLERAIFASEISAGRQPNACNNLKKGMFPMFFHGNRAIFSDMRKKGKGHLFWKRKDGRKPTDFETVIREFHRRDLEEVDESSTRPEKLDWKAGFSEAEIINSKVPLLLASFWTVLLASSTYFSVAELEDLFKGDIAIDSMGCIAAIGVVCGVLVVLFLLSILANKKLGQ